jgi:hypothetical protein
MPVSPFASPERGASLAIYDTPGLICRRPRISGLGHHRQTRVVAPPPTGGRCAVTNWSSRSNGTRTSQHIFGAERNRWLDSAAQSAKGEGHPINRRNPRKVPASTPVDGLRFRRASRHPVRIRSGPPQPTRGPSPRMVGRTSSPLRMGGRLVQTRRLHSSVGYVSPKYETPIHQSRNNQAS